MDDVTYFSLRHCEERSDEAIQGQNTSYLSPLKLMIYQVLSLCSWIAAHPRPSRVVMGARNDYILLDYILLHNADYTEKVKPSPTNLGSLYV